MGDFHRPVGMKGLEVETFSDQTLRSEWTSDSKTLETS